MKEVEGIIEAVSANGGIKLKDKGWFNLVAKGQPIPKEIEPEFNALKPLKGAKIILSIDEDNFVDNFKVTPNQVLAQENQSTKDEYGKKYRQSSTINFLGHIYSGSGDKVMDDIAIKKKAYHKMLWDEEW